MTDLTLEALAIRIDTIERKLANFTTVIPATRDWQSVVGISEETDFSRQMQAEMTAAREAERKAAQEGEGK